MFCTCVHEIVPGIPDNQAQIAVACEIHAGFDLRFCRGQNDVASVEASRTGAGRVAGGHASVVRLEGPQLANGVVGPCAAVSMGRYRENGVGGTDIHCSLPQLAWVSAHFAAS